jgi:hypothetical protein
MRVEKLKNHDLLNLKHEKQIEEFNKMYIYMNYSIHIMTSSSFLVTKKSFIQRLSGDTKQNCKTTEISSLLTTANAKILFK